jgi:DNA polymerase-3 subunit beta
MKLKVTQENLNKALSVVSRVAVSRTPTLPILANILIKADKNLITVSSTNLEIATTVRVAGKITEPGSITVPARLISEFVANLPDETIDMELNNQSLIIKSKQYKSTINGISAEEFPSLPTISKNTHLTIPSANLKGALSQTVFAASNDEARQVLTGVFMTVIDGELFLVATDSYRLAEKNIGKNDHEIKVLIPSSAMQDLARIIQDNSGDIDIYVDESQVQFSCGDVELISRLIDGNFPDYKQLIPANGEVTLTINKEDFINITKVSSLFARESAGSITLDVSEEKQEVSIRSIASQVGDNTSKASAKIKGEGDVTLNSRYLLDALNAFKSDSITMYFTGKTSPCVLRSADAKQADYQHIVMPLRS